jgi:hypothetical protein
MALFWNGGICVGLIYGFFMLSKVLLSNNKEAGVYYLSFDFFSCVMGLTTELYLFVNVFAMAPYHAL